MLTTHELRQRLRTPRAVTSDDARRMVDVVEAADRLTDAINEFGLDAAVLSEHVEAVDRALAALAPKRHELRLDDAATEVER